eukprot:7914677-Heterocapsa_arctica.AAC.1
MIRVASAPPSLESCCEKVLRSDEYGQTTRILPMSGPDCVPTWLGKSRAILLRSMRTSAWAL